LQAAAAADAGQVGAHASASRAYTVASAAAALAPEQRFADTALPVAFSASRRVVERM